MSDIDNEGIVNLCIALITMAKQEYEAYIECGQFVEARVRAEIDSRGLIGHILAWVCDDSKALLKDVIKRTNF